MINQVFIIKEQDFQNSDKIITFFSIDGIFTLISQGFNKKESHNRGNLQYFMLIEIEYFLRTKLKIGKLKTAKNLIFYKNIYNDSKKIHAGFLILKILSFIESSNVNYQSAFKLTQHVFDMLNKSKVDWLYATFYFMFNYLILNNIHFNTDCCVRSNSKQNIISINLSEGGFISEISLNHAKDKIYPINLLKIFKKINEEANPEYFLQLEEVNKIILWKIVYYYYIKDLGYFLPKMF